MERRLAPTGLLVTVAALLGLGAPSAPADADAADAAAVTFVDVPAPLRSMVERSVDLFDAADLELPPIEFVHHADGRDACRGSRGLHSHDDGQSAIQLCFDGTDPASESLLLHEVAHAWAAVGVDDERRDRFQELRGWTDWRNHAELDWHENGTEQAAEIIMWGVIDRPVAVLTIHQNSCDDLEAGYVVLTGAEPPHGYRDLC